VPASAKPEATRKSANSLLQEPTAKVSASAKKKVPSKKGKETAAQGLFFIDSAGAEPPGSTDEQ
jgi:hypothetical protein